MHGQQNIKTAECVLRTSMLNLMNQSSAINNICHFSVSLLTSVYDVKEGKQLNTLDARRYVSRTC
jgi:hypothetical protein